MALQSASMGNPIPLTERYFVGGINTMRGFKFGRAGPVTTSNSCLAQPNS